MNVRRGEKLEDWTIIHKLEDKEDLIIASVTNDKIPGVWIMKLKSKYYYEEIPGIKKYLIGCENAVKIPKDVIWHGENDDKYFRWYVMEKYDGDISKHCLFAKKNWKILLRDGLNFLKHIHLQGVVHGDIKSKNILYRESPVKFCVNDYEFLRNPEKNIIDPKLYIDYYYSYLGIPHKSAKFSYKADLVSFGYILWSMLISTVDVEINFNWQTDAINYYNKKEEYSYFEKLDSSRSKNSINMPYEIRYYFSIVDKLDWNSLESPDSSLYDELLKTSECV